MKKIIAVAVALLIMTALLFSLTSSAAEEEMLKIEVKDGSITVTVEGDFGGTDWIGFYPASQAGSYSGSILWWYLESEGGTWVLPEDEDVVTRNTDGVFDDEGNLVPGEYCAILLANDGYAPIDDMEPVFFEVKDYQEVMSRDQVTVDNVDKAAFGNNPEVTDISENLYPLLGKQLRFWGWYGNDKALDKYGIKIDGGEMQYSDPYEAADIVDHVKGMLKKDTVFASRFEIFADITEGEHTAEIFAIFGDNETLVWTINYRCLEIDKPTEAPTEVPTEAPTEAPTEVPTKAPTAEPVKTPEKTEEANATSAATADPQKGDSKNDKTGGPNTGLIIGIVCGVIVVAAIIAAVLISAKKRKKG